MSANAPTPSAPRCAPRPSAGRGAWLGMVLASLVAVGCESQGRLAVVTTASPPIVTGARATVSTSSGNVTIMSLSAASQPAAMRSAGSVALVLNGTRLVAARDAAGNLTVFIPASLPLDTDASNQLTVPFILDDREPLAVTLTLPIPAVVASPSPSPAVLP